MTPLSSSVFESHASFSGVLVDGAPSFHELDAEQAARGYRLIEMATEKTAPDTGRVLSARMVWRHHGAPHLAAPGGVLGVLFPVLNCKGMLERQVSTMLQWADLISEIVVLDGGSTDGTPEYLEQHFGNHPRFRVVRHPRGLWQSWNAGIALMTTEYVHIATAGDVMHREGAEHLLSVARSTGADLVISPPRILSYDGGAAPCTRWVIHEMLERFQVMSPRLMEPEALLHWTFWYAGGAPAMLGSSASNLYRVKLLQDYPFPTDASTAGDTAWGLLHIHRAKVAFTPRECADFIYHPAEGRPSMSDLRRLLFTHACRGAGLSRVEGEAIMAPDHARLDALMEIKAELAEIRNSWGSFWVLVPAGWMLQLKRSKLAKQVRVVPNAPPHFKAYLDRFIQCGGFRTDV